MTETQIEVSYQRELNEKGEPLNRTPLGPGRKFMRELRFGKRKSRPDGSPFTKPTLGKRARKRRSTR